MKHISLFLDFISMKKNQKNAIAVFVVHIVRVRPRKVMMQSPAFRDECLDRSLEFDNWATDNRGFWFPFAGDSTGLGSGFSFRKVLEAQRWW